MAFQVCIFNMARFEKKLGQILTHALHGMDKITARTGIIQIEYLN